MVKNEGNEFRVFGCLGFFVLLICIGTMIYLKLNCSKDSFEGQVFEGVGALFSGLAFIGVIATIILQRKELQLQRIELEQNREELRRTAEANIAIVEDHKELSVVDLYKEYKSAYLQEITKSAWRVLINCLSNKKYCDYFLKTYYAVDFKRNKFTSELAEIIKLSYPIKFQTSFDELKEIESDERYKLDSLINFFQILSFRLNKDFIRSCDFYYDWWRPLFWWLSDMRELMYEQDENKKQFCLKSNLSVTLKKLDEVYGFDSLNTPEERWESLVNHPMMKSIKIDKTISDFYKKK